MHPGDARVEVHRVAGRRVADARHRGRADLVLVDVVEPRRVDGEHRDGNAESAHRAVEEHLSRSEQRVTICSRASRRSASAAKDRHPPGWGGRASIRSRARLPTTATRRIGAAYRGCRRVRAK